MKSEPTESGKAGWFLPALVCAVFWLVGCERSNDSEAEQAPATTLAAPLPGLSIADADVVEGDAGSTDMVFSVSLSKQSADRVAVEFTTRGGSAAAGGDFVALSGSLQFAPGVTRRAIIVTVNADTDPEPDETLAVELSAPQAAVLDRASAFGTIVNDDAFGGVSGLDHRPDNQTCIAPARPSADARVAIVDAFPGLPNIALPTKMLLEPVADPRWFVLQKSGQLVTFDPDAADAVDPFLDLSGVVRTRSEGGLLGMAFHPGYPNTPEIFLSYTIDHNGPPMRSVISRIILDDVVDPGIGTVEQVILQVDQDFDNHNGGDIAFGSDGYLYIGLGDGGSGGDPRNRAQDTARLLGSMLRIDVLGPGVSWPLTPYEIPADNPFAANPKCGPGFNADPCPEIYAWGLRNPWRWSFDAASGALWLADVGQNGWEEINLIERGGNYGWRCREGRHDYNTSGCGGGLIDPVSEYGRGQGNSITGGLVYRGSAIPELVGRYLFADYGSGRLWALQSDGQGGYSNDLLIDTGYGPTSFAPDAAGEIYFTDINSSRLRRLLPAGAPAPDTIAERLSDSGCTDPADVTQPYAGLLPYEINAPFWSDGADKTRYLGLPNGGTITRGADGDWEFPNGSVIVKNFYLTDNLNQTRLVETRHLMRHPDGVWGGYTYEWNSQQTEAFRVRGGKTVRVNNQDWIFPSESQCLACHTAAAGFSLGPESAQFNRDSTYPATGRSANQLATLEQVLMFTTPLPAPPASLPRLADPGAAGAGLDARARAYLHTNCAQCHRPGGPTPSNMDLRHDTALASSNACDAVPLEGDLGIVDARLIAPGDASRSLLVARAGRRDSHGMPPLGSNLVDGDGVALLSAWIDGLGGCIP